MPCIHPPKDRQWKSAGTTTIEELVGGQERITIRNQNYWVCGKCRYESQIY